MGKPMKIIWTSLFADNSMASLVSVCFSALLVMLLTIVTLGNDIREQWVGLFKPKGERITSKMSIACENAFEPNFKVEQPLRLYVHTFF